jgi:hypothetical protein
MRMRKITLNLTHRQRETETERSRESRELREIRLVVAECRSRSVRSGDIV